MGLAVTTKDLDALDRKIIDQLQEDGRRSNVAIARALGVTETTIRHRIDRLISNGFIRIAAVIDPRKTPYQTDAMIWIRLDRRRARQAGEALAALPHVVYVAYTAGRYDMLIEALFESDDQIFEFLTTTLSQIPGVLQSETYHVLQTLKINYDWKLPLGLDGGGPDGAAGLRRSRGADPGRRRVRPRQPGTAPGMRQRPARGGPSRHGSRR